jgi:hypothetical protein
MTWLWNGSIRTKSRSGDEQMNYDDMTTSEIKKLLVAKMIELKGVNYAVGWLKTSYIFPMGEEIERSVAIKQLKEFDSEVV